MSDGPRHGGAAHSSARRTTRFLTRVLPGTRRGRGYLAAAAVTALAAGVAPAIAAASAGTTASTGVTARTAATASTVSVARPSGNPNTLVQVSAKPKLPGGARAVGAVAASTQVSAQVALALPDQSAVTAFIDATANPRSPKYHRYLSKGQFASKFGPSAATVATVESALRADGLKVGSVSSNRLLIDISGSAAKVGAAFHTGLEHVRLASGEMGQATTSAIRLPESVASKVTAVVGLNALMKETDGALRPIKALEHGKTAAPAKTAAVNGGPVACSDATAEQATGALTDQQIAAAYGLDPLYAASDLGQGQTVDIYELEPYLTSDVQMFDQCYFGADHTSQLSDTLVDGGAGTGPGSGEAALDIDNVSALAPGAKIHVFTGPNNNGAIGELDTWNAIAMADDARQVSSSWGLCETAEQLGMPGELQTENEIFEQTAAQGQTIYSSAGDDGSDDCAGHAATAVATDLSVDDPASQPYVTSVGGTTITNATEPPAETVWNNGNDGGAGGGGVSEAWAMPPWQSAVAGPQPTSEQACSDDPTGTESDNYHLAGLATTLPSGTECRETPDVSALADPQTGYTIVWDGGWYQIGGTSASTPLWAAITADINASTNCSSLPDGLGFATPLFYQVASSDPASYADAFSDVTAGNNDNLDVATSGTWSAAKGYDLASGLGTPRVTDANGEPGLDAQLCAAAGATTTAPAVSTLSATSGPVAGGTTVTIAGTNFGATQGSGNVFFGNADATVSSWSATSITVTTPAYPSPNGVPAGSAGRAEVTVVTSTDHSSAPSAGSVFEYTANSTGAPVVDYVSTADGLPAGGNTVDIIGSGFTGATAVDFGDVPATTFQVLKGGNELSVTVPESDGTCAVSATQGDCAVAVTVTTPDGTSSGPTILPAYTGPVEYGLNGAFFTPAGTEGVPQPEEYDYTAAPTITSVSPQYASENGDTVVITGTGFNLNTFDWVNVGQAGVGANQDFTIEGISPTTLTIGVPPAEPTVEPAATPISVQDAGGAGLLSNVSSFDYAGTPVLTSISKHLAAQNNPGNLTITGQGLSDVNSVVVQLQGGLSFLSSTSTAISDQSDTSLTVALPEGFAAPADVLVCSVSGCSTPNPAVDTLTLAYPGKPVINSIEPTSGPANGDFVMLINGSLDSELTAVHIGSASVTILEEPELTASGSIYVLVPPGTGGKKEPVTISTLGGTLTGTPTSNAVTFTYTRSSPTAPRKVSAKAGVRSATISWAAPSDNGGAAVTGYVITFRAAHHKTITVRVKASARKAVVRKLAAVRWSVEVQAVNKYGRGLPADVSVKVRS
jgi:Pro-kumamolisin, activation domain/IPT/TIG domain/Fibronectin type III domain